MAEKDEATEKDAPKRKKYKAKKPTRFIFKLLGLMVVGLIGYVGYYMYSHDMKPEDILDADKRKEIESAGLKDLGKVADASKPYVDEIKAKAKEYFYSISDLKKKIKGKPPETKEEQAALVEEAEKVAALPVEKEEPKETKTTSTDSKPKSTPKAKPKVSGTWGKAMVKYRAASAAFSKSHPMRASQADRQKYIRVAAPLYSDFLQLCDKARSEGMSGAKIDGYEQNASRCLYTCRKTMELRR